MMRCPERVIKKKSIDGASSRIEKKRYRFELIENDVSFHL
jgi:hypothetical protein